MTRLEALIAERTRLRKAALQAAAADVVRRSSEMGVDVRLFGSAARDDARAHSDLDLMVMGSPSPSQKTEIERVVADVARARNVPVHLLFADYLSPEQVRELIHD